MISAADQRLFLYFACATLTVLALVSNLPGSTSLAGDVRSKVLNYRAHAQDYAYLFLGDSRTYCGVNPERMGELLGGRVANLSTWAHWLPTQFPQIQDIVAAIPPQTRVVWSVGYQNFRPCQGCTTLTYPIGAANAQAYAKLGLPKALYEDNVRQLQPVDKTGRSAETGRQSLTRLYDRAIAWLQVPLGTPLSTSQTTQQAPAALLAHMAREPATAQAAFVYHGGNVTSIQRTFLDGGYERTELDPDFFRAQQRRERQQALAASPTATPLSLEPAFVALFEQTLDLFAAHDVNLVVNVMEEAPHTIAIASICWPNVSCWTGCWARQPARAGSTTRVSILTNSRSRITSTTTT